MDIAPPRRDGAGRRLRRISSRVGSVTAELARAFLSMLRTVAIQADRSGSAARAGNPGEELSTDERRISLRVKVPAEDGTAVVVMTGPAVPENGLQVFGDWCWPRLSSTRMALLMPRAIWSPRSGNGTGRATTS